MNQPTQAPELAPTLRRVWSDYRQTRSLKPTTIRNYELRLNKCFGDWLDLPLTKITKDMISERHPSIKGKAMANSAMRTLKALFHYASFKYIDETGAQVVKSNPVYRLSETRTWHKEKRRTRVIRVQELNAFMKAVFSLQNPSARDMLLILLLTGMRISEVRDLRWEHVDLRCGVIILPNTITKTGEQYIVPLSDYAWALLNTRSFGASSLWVFPGATESAPLTRSDKSINTVRRRSGIEFSPHDLRRSFATFADEIEIKHPIIKALLNHKSPDETEMYIQPSIERLRRATQQVTDYILVNAGMRKLRRE